MKYKFLVFSLLFYNVIATANRSHYPEKDIFFAGEWCGLYKSEFNKVPLAINLRLDPTFSEDRKEIIKASFQLFMERILNHDVVTCAYANAISGLYRTQEEFEKEMLDALSLRKLDDLKYPGHIYIARIWDEPRHLAFGHQNFFYKQDTPTPGYPDRHYFYVALNSDFIGYESLFPSASDVRFWAGVLTHVFLHNLGYTHPLGVSGSFVNEIQQCVATYGERDD